MNLLFILAVRYVDQVKIIVHKHGLKYVVALLLIVMKTKEDAFWASDVLENVLVSDCYIHNLFGCHVEHREFRYLLEKKLPR